MVAFNIWYVIISLYRSGLCTRALWVNVVILVDVKAYITCNEIVESINIEWLNRVTKI